MNHDAPVVRSLLENDLYKFSMWQALLHCNPGAQAEYRFVCRNTPEFPLADLRPAVEAEMERLCSLSFTQDELDYLRNLRFIKSDFVDFLGLFQLNEKYISITPLENGDISIRTSGPWLHTIMFEIPVLAIVSEVYMRRTHPGLDF
ncbi:MAG: nicotinate phosphoribosyltransferase, partial [Rhodocyclaceae bacterium]|nr:nicotinate phosphoribosyltransferase [Rhodocyclaceae bacterium]